MYTCMLIIHVTYTGPSSYPGLSSWRRGYTRTTPGSAGVCVLRTLYIYCTLTISTYIVYILYYARTRFHIPNLLLYVHLYYTCILYVLHYRNEVGEYFDPETAEYLSYLLCDQYIHTYIYTYIHTLQYNIHSSILAIYSVV